MAVGMRLLFFAYGRLLRGRLKKKGAKLAFFLKIV